MSLPVSPLRPSSSPQLPGIEATAELNAVSDGTAITKPLDFLLISSRADFPHSCRKFADGCREAAVHAEIIYIEDLPGTTSGEKLASLHRLNVERQASGAVTPSTIKVALLHGWAGVAPADASLDRFRQEHLGMETCEPPGAEQEGKRSPAPARAHMMTAAEGRLAFPTDLVDAALRATAMADGEARPGFADTVIYAGCASGLYRDAARTTGGSYVFASGKKSAFTEDVNAGLHAVVMEQGQRKRQNLPPLSGRDCWNVMRNLSGEHVSFVGNDAVEVHKAVRTVHSEPVLGVRSAGASQEVETTVTAQAIRLLFAKANHGSAATVKRVIDRWGPAILAADHAAVIPGVSLWSIAIGSARDAEQKALLLLSHMPEFFSHGPLLEDRLKCVIAHQRTHVLVESFRRMTAIDPLPLPQEEFVIWLRSMPEETEQLIKLCRRSRDLSESLGSYLARVRREQARQPHRGYFNLPIYFEALARKAEDRYQRTSAQ